MARPARSPEGRHRGDGQGHCQSAKLGDPTFRPFDRQIATPPSVAFLMLLKGSFKMVLRHPPVGQELKRRGDLSTMETERAKRLADFVSWVGANIKGDEKGEAQVFLDRFFQAFGHAGVKEAGATLEERIKKATGRGPRLPIWSGSRSFSSR